jgi:hypothetical protein
MIRKKNFLIVDDIKIYFVSIKKMIKNENLRKEFAITMIYSPVAYFMFS